MDTLENLALDLSRRTNGTFLIAPMGAASPRTPSSTHREGTLVGSEPQEGQLRPLRLRLRRRIPGRLKNAQSRLRDNF